MWLDPAGAQTCLLENVCMRVCVKGVKIHHQPPASYLILKINSFECKGLHTLRKSKVEMYLKQEDIW